MSALRKGSIGWTANKVVGLATMLISMVAILDLLGHVIFFVVGWYQSMSKLK